MEAYETSIMDMAKLRIFTEWLDREIGTEYEINHEDDGQGYVMVFDLTYPEVIKIRNKENEMSHNIPTDKDVLVNELVKAGFSDIRWVQKGVIAFGSKEVTIEQAIEILEELTEFLKKLTSSIRKDIS